MDKSQLYFIHVIMANEAKGEHEYFSLPVRKPGANNFHPHRDWIKKSVHENVTVKTYKKQGFIVKESLGSFSKKSNAIKKRLAEYASEIPKKKKLHESVETSISRTALSLDYPVYFDMISPPIDESKEFVEDINESLESAVANWVIKKIKSSVKRKRKLPVKKDLEKSQKPGLFGRIWKKREVPLEDKFAKHRNKHGVLYFDPSMETYYGHINTPDGKTHKIHHDHEAFVDYLQDKLEMHPHEARSLVRSVKRNHTVNPTDVEDDDVDVVNSHVNAMNYYHDQVKRSKSDHEANEHWKLFQHHHAKAQELGWAPDKKINKPARIETYKKREPTADLPAKLYKWNKEETKNG